MLFFSTIYFRTPNYGWEEKFETALWLHSLYILKFETSKLTDFNPDTCEINQNWYGLLADVTCYALTKDGEEVIYTHSYSRINRVFDKYYKYLGNRGNKLKIVSKEVK